MGGEVLSTPLHGASREGHIVVIVQLAQFLGNWLSKKVMRR